MWNISVSDHGHILSTNISSAGCASFSNFLKFQISKNRMTAIVNRVRCFSDYLHQTEAHHLHRRPKNAFKLRTLSRDTDYRSVRTICID